MAKSREPVNPIGPLKTRPMPWDWIAQILRQQSFQPQPPMPADVNASLHFTPAPPDDPSRQAQPTAQTLPQPDLKATADAIRRRQEMLNQ